MVRLIWFCLAGGIVFSEGFLFAQGSGLAAAEARQPNIVWIVGENFSNDFACYGQANVRTPNLDGLRIDPIKDHRIQVWRSLAKALDDGVGPRMAWIAVKQMSLNKHEQEALDNLKVAARRRGLTVNMNEQ